MFERIVVGYTGDEAGRDAVKLAGALAAALGASVTVVYPYSPLLCAVPADAAEQRIREELVEQSDRLDLLVLGSRAYGPLRHVLLGSVSAPVMREAHCPVLVVPRGSQPDESDAEGKRGAVSAGAG